MCIDNDFIYEGGENSDNGEEVLKSDSRCSWQEHSRRVGANVGDKSTESRSALQPLRIPSVLLPEQQTSVLRRRLSDLLLSTDGQ